MRCIIALLWVVALVGCAARQTSGPHQALPRYDELVERYNRNLRGLDQMWARAVVVVRWVDHDGRRHTEQGNNSTFMMRGSDHLALSVGKLNTAIWIGCDSQRYWFFDLLDERIAYVGRHDQFHLLPEYTLPMQVRPVDLPKLLGLVPLDPMRLPDAPQVVRFEGNYIIAPPGTGSRITVDPNTALPIKVELFARNGQLVAVAELRDPDRVEMHNVAQGGWATVQTRIHIELAASEESFTIQLSDMTDAGGRLHEKKRRALQNAFDFDRLKAGLNVGQVIDLDQRD
jgi:hypothetical protein